MAITLDADSVAAATRLALGMIAELDFPLTRVEVLSTADFDDVLSVPEAAAELGVSAQAIRQRLEAGPMNTHTADSPGPSRG